ncbi:hypothetical protein NKG94_34570 [Micromonospora sp. M12]
MTSSADIPDRPAQPIARYGVTGEQLADHIHAVLDQAEVVRVRDMIPVEDGGPFAEYEPGPWRSA